MKYLVLENDDEMGVMTKEYFSNKAKLEEPFELEIFKPFHHGDTVGKFRNYWPDVIMIEPNVIKPSSINRFAHDLTSTAKYYRWSPKENQFNPKILILADVHTFEMGIRYQGLDAIASIAGICEMFNVRLSDEFLHEHEINKEYLFNMAKAYSFDDGNIRFGRIIIDNNGEDNK